MDNHTPQNTKNSIDNTIFVYVVSAESVDTDIDFRWIKIGITKDIPKRLTQLQRTMKTPLTLNLTLTFKDKRQALTVEKILLDKFNPKRMAGEWFVGDLSEVVDTITWAMEFSSNVDNVTRYIARDIVPTMPKDDQLMSTQPVTFVTYALLILIAIYTTIMRFSIQ